MEKQDQKNRAEKQASWAKRQVEKADKRANLARERNARVLTVDSPEVHPLLNALRSADRALKKIRMTMGSRTGIPMSEAAAIIEKWETAKDAFVAEIGAICTAAGLPVPDVGE